MELPPTAHLEERKVNRWKGIGEIESSAGRSEKGPGGMIDLKVKKKRSDRGKADHDIHPSAASVNHREKTQQRSSTTGTINSPSRNWATITTSPISADLVSIISESEDAQYPIVRTVEVPISQTTEAVTTSVRTPEGGRRRKEELKPDETMEVRKEAAQSRRRREEKERKGVEQASI